jgi:hypothetical protein
LSQVLNHLRDLFTINIDLSSPEKIQQSVEVQQAKNQEIQTYTEAIETFNSAAGMIFPVVGSAAEIMANAEAGNNTAALAAVPWLLVDIATAGKGNTVKSGVKAVTKLTNKEVFRLAQKQGMKETKQFGKSHGELVFQKGNKYYSYDNTAHNGGVWKVFEKAGNELKRIGTATEDLLLIKK